MLQVLKQQHFVHGPSSMETHCLQAVSVCAACGSTSLLLICSGQSVVLLKSIVTCSDQDSCAAGLYACQQHWILLVADCQRLQQWWLGVSSAGTPLDGVCCTEGQ